MSRRRVTQFVVGFIALFLVGTVIVLSSISYYLSIDPSAYLSELEVPYTEPSAAHKNASTHDRIPRIIHQTWKTETLPERWQPVSKSCRDLNPDYEYMLWTDESSRQFISDHYSWFLDTYEHYKYTIQRADAIRYFVLYHYGGIYIDLDIGCQRPIDPLLPYPVILPKTIPVGVSNDLMFAEQEHPFLAQTIHNLATFDHNWIINYPTVMFSTGPMFLSIQYAIYVTTHPGSVRILPKSLYGKNAKKGEAPHSFFAHYYGSSWHADDAGFIWFLGTKGKLLMWIGLAVVILGVIRLLWPTRKSRRSRRYDIQLPGSSASRAAGGWHIQLGSWSTDASSSGPNSPEPDDEPSSSVPLILRSSSPTPSDASELHVGGRRQSTVVAAYERLRNGVVDWAGYGSHESRSPSRSGRSRNPRGVLFFLPAIFTSHASDVEMATHSRSPRPPPGPPPAYPADKQRYANDFEHAGLSHLLSDASDDDFSSLASSSRANHHRRESSSPDRYRRSSRSTTPAASRSASRAR